MSEMDEIIKEFLVESNDNLDQLDRDLVELEKDPDSTELLGRIFRAIHTVKGTSGVLGFGKLESIAHVGENLLSKMRDRKLRLTSDITTGLLSMVDAIREVLNAIESTGSEGDGEYSKVIDQLKQLLENNGKKPTHPPLGQILLEQTEQAIEEALEAQHKGDPRKLGEILVDHGVVPPTVVQEALKTQQSDSAPHLAGSSIRVDVNLLDKLMNLVGELVLARNQILQFTGTQKDTSFVGTAQRLNLITTELQEGVMKTRMQPIGNVWNKFPRVVRDLASQFGKQVRIEMEGSDTELDKTIIEAIKDPLTHIVRNSVDHGIETPDDRVAAGKAVEGCLKLRAFHEGGQVNIEIIDDGRGIDIERLKQKAVEAGQISTDRAMRLSEREALNLVFLPGLSTASKVTNVSGRGVGMDVVKTNIEKIGGAVDMQSVKGEGTTLKIKIPLTLAIIPALIATSGKERFAIPQVSLLELVRLEGEQAEHGIEMIHGAPVYRLRGNLLPLVYLSRVLEMEKATAKLGQRSKAKTLEFRAARERHLAWKDRLRKFLDGTTAISEQEAGSPRDCDLGKWLYETGLHEFGDVPELAILEETHRAFHDLVRSIVQLKRNGHNAEAEVQFADVGSLSSQIAELLTKTENKVAQCLATNIVVLQADDRQFGLVVDEINDTEEIVVKPLGKQFKGMSCFAGATIMGDGSVALILDVIGIAQIANVVTEVRESTVLAGAQAKADRVVGRDAWLVFQVAENRRMAIPLSIVSRLEEFPATLVERSGSELVVQYRGQIMPLIDIARHVGLVPGADRTQTLQVVVYSSNGRSVGLIVDRIVDIVEQAVTVENADASGSLVGSAVIQDRVTDLLNVAALVKDTANQEAAR